MEVTGPTTVAKLLDRTGWAEEDVDLALAKLESRGIVLRGWFTPA
jgi:hypothetical protein